MYNPYQLLIYHCNNNQTTYKLTMSTKFARLPQLLDRKIYKTGQTRGADDDVIFQNRVGRNSTVLIPYRFWSPTFLYPDGEDKLENGYIVLLNPETYFEDKNIETALKKSGLELGKNCLVFYETRSDWNKYNPDKLSWTAAQNRKDPLGGKYVARVPATTASSGGEKIIRGFTTTSGKGAGIRLYEYASSSTNAKCRLQLEAIYWLCVDSVETVIRNGMAKEDATARKSKILELCKAEKLLDYKRLREARVIDSDNNTICPLCLGHIPAMGFFTRMIQAEGREVSDLTVTEINLFHVLELRFSAYNHRPYNLGWGHHHCNVVTKDSGIQKTLEWMQEVLKRNIASGFKV